MSKHRYDRLTGFAGNSRLMPSTSKINVDACGKTAQREATLRLTMFIGQLSRRQSRSLLQARGLQLLNWCLNSVSGFSSRTNSVSSADTPWFTARRKPIVTRIGDQRYRRTLAHQLAGGILGRIVHHYHR